MARSRAQFLELMKRRQAGNLSSSESAELSEILRPGAAPGEPRQWFGETELRVRNWGDEDEADDAPEPEAHDEPRPSEPGRDSIRSRLAAARATLMAHGIRTE